MSEDELKKYHHFKMKTGDGIELDLIETKYYEGLLDLCNNQKQRIETLQVMGKILNDRCDELKALEEEHKKENGELRKELEEYNKRGQTLHNLMNAKDTYMYKEICKNFIPKDKIEARIKELEGQDDWYREHNSLDSLFGRINELVELLEEE